MNPYSQSVCRLVVLGVCCVLFTVRESDSTFVPGRCLCPRTQLYVRRPMKDLEVHPISTRCDKVTVIVTLKNNDLVCLDPEGQMGLQLIHCWKRSHLKGRNVKQCLKRRRRRRGRGGPRQRSHGKSESTLPSS